MAPSFSRDEDSSLFDLLQAERNTGKALKHEGKLTPPKNQLSMCTYCAKQITSNDVHQSQLFRDDTDFRDPNVQQMPGSVLTFLKCSTCRRDHVLWALNTWWDIKAILHSADVTRDGLLEVQTHAEKLALFILSQVCHNQLDYDTSEKTTSPFLPPNAQELGKIMWERGEAIGFYTLLPAGTQIHAESSHDSYALPVVDTVYIREQYRGQGKCARIVEDVVKTYPSQDIGFSDPISQSLLRVLEKYLEKHPECRDHMWEASYSGDEGYRRNVWLHIRRLKREEGKSSSSHLDKLTLEHTRLKF